MFDRIALPTVQAAAHSFPVVVIVGARQVGKTTLARTAFPRIARDLEDPRTAERWTSTAISTGS
jgi:predicted AAA+ superfamily ATPase